MKPSDVKLRFISIRRCFKPEAQMRLLRKGGPRTELCGTALSRFGEKKRNLQGRLTRNCREAGGKLTEHGILEAKGRKWF